MKAEKRKDEVSIADITVSDLSAILKKLLDEGKRRDIVVKSLAPKTRSGSTSVPTTSTYIN